MKFRWDKKYLYWGITAFSVISASMLFYFGLFHMDILLGKIKSLMSVLMPVVWGIVIAYLLTPIVNFLENQVFFSVMRHRNIKINAKKKKVVRYICVFIALILGLLILYSLFSMIVPSIVESMISIVNDSPRYVQNFTHWMSSILKDNEELQTTVFNLIDNYSYKIENWMNQQLLPQLRDILQHLTVGVFGALIFVKNILIGVIISIYLMISKEIYLAQGKMFLYALFETERANFIIKACRFTNKTFTGFVSGKVVDSAIIGVLCYIITSILGTPYKILVSVIVGVTNIIPFFGPYLGAIPSAFIILLVNPVQCLYFLIAILLLQQFDGNILGPKILGESTGLSSFMVIVAILLFGGFMGITGMVIGVPLWAVICAGVKHLRDHFLRKKHLPVEDQIYIQADYMDSDSLTPVNFHSKPAENKPKN
ncbi:MAG: AI-2E family transporter [Blautia sp.]